MSPREGWILLDREAEEVLRTFVLSFRKPVHVPQAAMVSLPGVERTRRLQDRTIALCNLDLARDRGDDSIADLVQHAEGVIELVRECVRPHDPGRAGFDELDRDDDTPAVVPHHSRRDVIDAEPPASLLGTDAFL